MWSNEEISQFQIDNNRALAEINATLQPDKGLSGKVGIFIPGQMGDLMTAMSVLKYRNEVFPGKEIVWFANFPNAEALKYAPISEIRPWPWPGNGLPKDHPGDLWPVLCNENNRLNLDLAKNYELTADLDDGWFPAPYMRTPPQRHGLDYPSVSKKIFGIPDEYKWHPYLSFSYEDERVVDYFFKDMGIASKKVMIETFAGSGQSKFDEDMLANAMSLCNEHWPHCIFIFASHKFLKKQELFPEGLFEQPNVYSCAKLSVRQCALIAERCNLFLSVSSGITVAASTWTLKSPPIIQYTGSLVCSTKTLANGPFELVTADGKKLETSKGEYYNKLTQILNQYK